jgi:hypothetical protein
MGNPAGNTIRGYIKAVSIAALIFSITCCAGAIHQPEQWSALYVTEVIYRDPGDNIGFLYQIGDTLLSEQEISSEDAADILDSVRPLYNIGVGCETSSGHLRNVKDHYRRYRYFILRSGDSAEDIIRNSIYPSVRGMLSEEIREASDLLIRNYNAEVDSLKRKWFRSNLDEIMERRQREYHESL